MLACHETKVIGQIFNLVAVFRRNVPINYIQGM